MWPGSFTSQQQTMLGDAVNFATYMPFSVVCILYQPMNRTTTTTNISGRRIFSNGTPSPHHIQTPLNSFRQGESIGTLGREGAEAGPGFSDPQMNIVPLSIICN